MYIYPHKLGILLQSCICIYYIIICHHTGILSAAALTNERNAVAIVEDESSYDNVFGRLMDLIK